jgi:hypothetical protein
MGRTTETNSLEVRWFETGAPPEELDEWVTGYGPVDTSTRTDLYAAPLDPSFNLKLRGEGGGSVELKRRLGGPDRHTFAPDVTGRVEQWYKWSFSLDHTPGLWETDRTDLWLPVTKTRTLAAFDGADLQSFDEGLSADGVTAHVELTAVEACSETAWTCGLEVAGRPDEFEEAFVAVGSELFGDGFPVGLSAAQSLGYAAWLERLATDRVPAPEVRIPSNR